MNGSPGWLDGMPSHWRRLAPKAIFTERRERSRPEDVHLTPSQSHGVLPQAQYMEATGNKVVLNLAGQDAMKHVELGDFIIHLRSFQGGLEYSSYRGKVSAAYVVITARGQGYSNDFFRWLLKSDAFIQELRTTTNQLRDGQSIRFRDFAKVPLPVPPVDEQRAIADYLDRETAQIDTLIAEQQRLIELLHERRTVAVHSAIAPLTRLYPVDRIGRFTRIGNGSTPRRERADFWADTGVPWLNSSTINQRYVSVADQFVTETALTECHLPVLRPGTVLVGLTGQGRTRGMAALLRIEATVSQHIGYVVPDESRWVPEFLLWSLTSNYDALRASSEENGSTKGGLTCDALSRQPAPMPPLDEQRRIVAELNEITSKIDTLIAEAERFIELAKERRSALITAAVTGQIEIPGVG